jgi:multidrug efflux system outer membrane protein
MRAGQLPTCRVSAGVSNSRTSAETSQGLALGHRSIEGNNSRVGAALSWELDLWGRVRRIVEAADAQALAAQDDRDGVLLMLSSQVAHATGSCAAWTPSRRSCATRWPPGARRRN